ncbi:MAG TPA: hypothetical protein VGK81_14290, partial [Anaerolineae bacterium]
MQKLIAGSGMRCVLAAIGLMGLVACDANRSPLAASSPTVVKAGAPALQAEMTVVTSAHTPAGTATTTPRQTAAPANKSTSPLIVTRLITIASNLSEPDDLALAPDG